VRFPSLPKASLIAIRPAPNPAFQSCEGNVRDDRAEKTANFLSSGKSPFNMYRNQEYSDQVGFFILPARFGDSISLCDRCAVFS
jgi:hypothetical protein